MRGVIIGKATKPLEQEYEITIRLPLSDLVTLVEQMKQMQGNSSYPSWQVIDGIEDVIRHSKEHFVKTITND